MEPTEIPAPRNNHINWLRNFRVGDTKEADLDKMTSIRSAITRLHKTTSARFRVRKKTQITRLK